MPVILLAGLALLGGGFDVEGRHLAGIFAWLLVGGLLLSPLRVDLRFGRAFLITAGLFLAVALFSALSSLWSDSTSRSLIEAERAIAYLGFFTAAYLVCRTPLQRQRFAEGIAIAVALIVFLGLADRCFPGSGPVAVDATARLRYPLGYWNANGLVFGVGITLFAWMARSGSWTTLRWSAVALIPAAMSGLYLTYSRGGLLAGLIAAVLMVLLSEHRLRFASGIIIGAVVAVPAVFFIRSQTVIAENLGGIDAPGQGRAVAAVILLSMALSVLIYWLLLRAAKARPSFTRRAVSVSRNRLVPPALAGTVAVALITLAAVFGGHVWEQFSNSPVYFPANPEEHFTQFSGAGRYEFNQVAIEGFRENPILGAGAGTYTFEWLQNRPIDLVAQNAHSLYLEAFSNLGIFGGILVLALIGTLLTSGILAFRRSTGESRDLAAVLLAVQVPIVISLSFDWFWELAATAALLMLVSAALLAEKEGGPRTSERRGADRPRAGIADAKARTFLGLMAVWVALVVLFVPLGADHYMTESREATAQGRLADAVRDADRSEKLDPYSPLPHVQRGVIAQYLGLEDLALAKFSRAIELEPRNWQWWYLRMGAHAEAGDESAAALDYEQALSLNPRSPQLQTVPKELR